MEGKLDEICEDNMEGELDEIYEGNMDGKLDEIYDFLTKNRSHNKELQTRYYQSLLGGRNDTEDRVIALLYNTYDTQSQPKMDKLATFMQYIDERSPDCLRTFNGFIEAIIPGAKPSYKNLYEGLCADTTKEWGWGPKTAALFSKVIYHLHMDGTPYGDELSFWEDAPNCIEDDDRLWLPVDEVIFQIFREISPKKHIKGVNGRKDKNINWTFKNINEEIYDLVKCEKDEHIKDIELWDDLWFWGFITQRIREVNPNGKIMTEEEIRIRVENGEERETIRNLEWNENKYWSQRDTSKDKDTIKDIRNEARKFIKIVKN